MSEIYDIVIIGGGPAGLTAGIYACRARMKTLLIEQVTCGGQVLIADIVENVPGFSGGVRGPELVEEMVKQAGKFGLNVKMDEAKEISAKNGEKGPFTVLMASGERIEALALIIATGARWNSLGIPGERELTGRGVSYCATCDGPLFRDKEVAVVGGGDTAVGDALFLAKFARKVTIIHRRSQLRAARIMQERVHKNDRIGLRLNSVAVEITGRSKVEGVRIKDVATGKDDIVKADGVFVLIGVTPNSDIVKGAVKTDEKGYIMTDIDMHTSAEGIFACGDVRKKALRQIATAIGEGAAAAFTAEHYVEGIKGSGYK
ncbi:MAG: thioredoxin-disulfide reductase [Candidatus Omnitrophota bacterium]